MDQAGLIQARRALSPEYSERLVRHEAGHLLVGYAMGLPVDAYRADDPVRFAVQFIDPRPAAGAWRGLEHDDVDRLCAVSLAGVVAEAMRFGDGIGGVADLAQLQGAPCSLHWISCRERGGRTAGWKRKERKLERTNSDSCESRRAGNNEREIVPCARGNVDMREPENYL